jgi:hypothetical protein
MYRKLSSMMLVLLLLASSMVWSAEAPPTGIVVPAFGVVEQSKAQGITLSGPATLNVGQDGVYRLSGTPAVDLSKPLLDQLGWALGVDRMYVYALSPKVAKTPLDVRLELVIAAEGVTLQPVIHLIPAVVGEHRIVVDWNHGQDQLAEIIVQVGGEPGPNPPVPPIPPVPPNPTAKWQVAFFFQSETLDNLPSGQRDMISGRVFRDSLTAKGDAYLGGFDVDTMAKTIRRCDGTKCYTVYAVPADLVAFWDAVKGDPLPRIAIAPLDGGDVRDFPMPMDVAAFWALLEAQK